MRKNATILVVFTSLLAILYSCKDLDYVLKSQNKRYKFARMMEWYKAGNYTNAIPVLEDIIPYYKGTDTVEMLYYMLAEGYMARKEYLVAAYHFKSFKELYPKNTKAELASYYIGECYQKEIPRIALEQTSVDKAVEYFKAFLSEYPNSPFSNKATEQLDKLRRLKELKELDAANLYYKTSNYRAATVYFKNILKDFPDIKEYEYLSYMIVLSDYKFAGQSITNKQVERYETTLKESQIFIDRFPKSKYLAEIKTLNKDCIIQILESAYKKANTFYLLNERPEHFQEAISIYNEYEKDINKDQQEFYKNYVDKCYLGILESSYTIVDETKDKAILSKYKEQFLNDYYTVIDKFKKGSNELQKAQELYQKINKFKS